MQRIKMLQSVQVPMVGLFKEGETYILQEEITQILISRNLAEPVEAEKKVVNKK